MTNGTTYFYVVTAVDTRGNQSANSNEASATPVADTTDTVTITKAQYKTKPQRLQIQAESTDPSAVLTAFDADTNVELGVLVDGKLNIRTSSPPARVRVDSNQGGSDTKDIQVQ